jgi:3-deoxy-D-manno-octulosonic acid kinase
MNLKLEQTASSAIVYDADCIQQPTLSLFDPPYWRSIGAVRETAPGRGHALMLDTTYGPLVMRSYRRGGWAARVSHDRYLFTGFGRSRSLMEMRLLADCIRLGLPVPQPVAGLCLRHGLTCSAVLLTRRIMPAFTLADLLDPRSGPEPDWLRMGRCIRRFHDAGVVHPDLNVRNILFGEHGGSRDDIYLIDFDRAYIYIGSRRPFRAGLRRLHRSLKKTWPAARRRPLENCWTQLIRGYNNEI